MATPLMDWRCSTSRKRAYGYRYTEAFLSQVAHSGGAERLTDALARWTTQLWHAPDETPEQAKSLTGYIDGHRKPVYTDGLIPRGLVGRLSTVLGCRALVLLHDAQGHPLLVTTHRGDQHLTIGLPLILAHYEQIVDQVQVNRIIVDREGMAAEFLASLHEARRTMVTVLRTDQYQDLASFSELGAFVPLSTDAQGQVVREVAPARIALPRPDHPGEVLSLRVALIRDLRRWVPVQPCQQDADLPQRWDADLPRAERQWWEEGWQATAAPIKETTPKLIPIVTTDAVELAQTSIHCWPEPRKRHQRLLTAVRIGHQSRFCENTRGELRSGQATSQPAAAARQAQAVGARGQSPQPRGGKTA